MNATDIIGEAVVRCANLETRTLEDFLGNLIEENLDSLANMPGMPAQVLASQFTYYAKSSTVLREPFTHDRCVYTRLMATVLRLPMASKIKAKS